MKKLLFLGLLVVGLFIVVSCAPGEGAIAGQATDLGNMDSTVRSCVESSESITVQTGGRINRDGVLTGARTVVQPDRCRGSTFFDYSCLTPTTQRLHQVRCDRTERCVNDIAQPCVLHCTDSDPLNDIAVRGEVTITQTGVATSDSCLAPSTRVPTGSVSQVDCVGGRARTLPAQACPSGTTCSDGACVPLCGNGVVDTGENCATCVADVVCMAGQVCQEGACVTDETVILLIDSRLSDMDLTTFLSDLQNEGYNVILEENRWDTPEGIRDYLKNSYELSPRQVGAILIGEIPYAYQVIETTYINPNIPGTTEEAISFRFYADLDGNFLKENPEFPNAYSVHNGNTDSEIWIGVLPFYETVDKTKDKLTYYFNKNHKYRTGEFQYNKGFVEINEHYNANTLSDYEYLYGGIYDGEYSSVASSLDYWENIDLFFENSVERPRLTEGYSSLNSNNYRVLAQATHGSPTNAGTINNAWLSSNNINVPFILIGGCNSGKLDYPVPPILEELVYNENSKVLVAQGTTTASGGMGTNNQGFFGDNIISSLTRGASFGDAINNHINNPLIWPWSNNKELHHDIVVLMGDPTLKFH